MMKRYYRPYKTALTETALRDMQRAGIELAACSSNKPEAVDRLIESDIVKVCTSLTEAHADAMLAREKLRVVCASLREMCGLDPNLLTENTLQQRCRAERSTIVLISGDFDFKGKEFFFLFFFLFFLFLRLLLYISFRDC